MRTWRTPRVAVSWRVPRAGPPHPRPAVALRRPLGRRRAEAGDFEHGERRRRMELEREALGVGTRPGGGERRGGVEAARSSGKDGGEGEA
jgi:hypothetical protein